MLKLKLSLRKAFVVVSSFCLFANIWLLIHITRKKRTEIHNEPKLIIASVIFRHGDRNPTRTFPTDPNRDVSWPEGRSALTQIGVEQAYELGAYLRRRYASLLGDGPHSDDIVYVQSSKQSRTLITGAICLAALLFPSKKDQILNRDLSWQSLPIYTVSKEEDYILYHGKKCQRYERAFDEYLESPEFTALMARHKKMFRQLQKRSGMEINTFHDAKRLYNVLWIEKLQNKTLPAWGIEALENDDFKRVVGQTYQLKTNTTLLARLHSGFFIREILESLQQKINGTLSPDRSLFLYSASGNTIAKVLNALGLFDVRAPPYASSLHFEVYSSNDEYHMQIIYRNTDDENPCPLEIPSCGAKCSLEQFKSIYSTIIPTGTFDEECELS
ncbi:prostatic acid phosphatase-like isoform X1 [Sitodiplosis mosellana]|uniref:prostatic acid phosphatase-like isoform X1 n=1 Tax=Sitodiplosis mosellana TaxID=263140 RepID=UPI0024444D4B|nr:prostatic acid phosphatase-like isoform X1 [Sitodiplosis mosellana]